MRRLKVRPSLDQLKNQPRSRRQSIIKMLYICGVIALTVWIGNLFVGDLIYFRSEGMVLGEPAIVAAEFPVTVRQISVKEGQDVSAGEVTAVVTSQNVVENIARLAAEIATREARISEMRVRRQTIEAVIGVAADRQMAASTTREEYEKLLKQGYLALDKRTAVVESEFRSKQDLETLRAEKRVIDSEIETLSHAFAQAESALNEMRRLYDGGMMRSPIDGVISRIAAEKGAVVRAGDPMVEVYGKQRYVLAYIPTGALYDVYPGDRVWIETGFSVAEGRVTHVQPFAAALPREFQRSFSPVDRRQVMRIEFADQAVPPPLFAKVKLRSISVMPAFVRSIYQPPRVTVAEKKS